MNFIENIFAAAHANGQTALTEAQCYQVFNRLGLETPKWQLFDMDGENFEAIISSFDGDKLALKISSPDILHKTEVGGVKIVTKTEAKKTFEEFKKKFPKAEGVLAVEFVKYTPFTLGTELMLGVRADEAFGPLTVLGLGGTGAEFLTKNLKPGASPSIALSANVHPEEFVSNNLAAHYMHGLVRGAKKHADIKLLTKWVSAMSTLINYFSDEAGNAWTVEEAEINPLAVSEGKLVALDGVIRFRQAESKTRSLPSKEGLRSLLRPNSVGVVGVSEKNMNMGRIILNNIISAGMAKENIYIVKPGETKEIDGVPCYATCADLPAKIDCLIITVPAAAAPDVIKDAAASGKIKSIVLISGGVGEKEGSEGLKEDIENLIVEARKTNPDFMLNGGNSLGIVSNPSKVNTLFIPKNKLTPPLGVNEKLKPCAFLSQSGAFVVSTLSKNPWLKPVYSVTVGNQLDATVTDYASYAVEDEDVKVLLLYIEGFKFMDGRNLVNVVERAKELNKDVIIYKAGRTAAGQKAVMGHTASIAGSYTVTKTLLERAGAIMADTFEEFETLANMCMSYNRTNGKTFMISNGGFETSGMADNIEDGDVITCPFPSDKLKEEMKAVLKTYKLDSIVDVRNPFDITPMAPDAAYFDIISAAAKSGEYGQIVYSMIPLSPVVKTLPEENPDVFAKLAKLKEETGLPVYVVVAGGEKFDVYASMGRAEGFVVMRDADKLVKMITKFVK
ncbi:acyl-CoA synthetase (NDP forming) [Elusimicrobium simillimum]|uniref:acetate--CoA ligase family protein n=1 Tax=Elusimicrobium simillimum TaxID=3143438 RepID=UPI003C7053D1